MDHDAEHGPGPRRLHPDHALRDVWGGETRLDDIAERCQCWQIVTKPGAETQIAVHHGVHHRFLQGGLNPFVEIGRQIQPDPQRAGKDLGDRMAVHRPCRHRQTETPAGCRAAHRSFARIHQAGLDACRGRRGQGLHQRSLRRTVPTGDPRTTRLLPATGIGHAIRSRSRTTLRTWSRRTCARPVLWGRAT